MSENSKTFSSTENIIENASNWSLAKDVELLKYLESFSEKLIDNANQTNDKLNELLDNLNKASVSLNIANNRFQSLHNSQFIENRVYEEDETLQVQELQTKKEENKKLTEDEKLERIKNVLMKGIDIVDKYFEKIEVPGSDSEDDNEFPSFTLRPKDPYSDRPLPYLIGTEEWHKKWHVGLLETSSESEEGESAENYSSSDSEDTLPIYRPQVIEGMSGTSSEANLSNTLHLPEPIANSTSANSIKNLTTMGEDSEERNSYPSQAPIKSNVFAQQLAAKLEDVFDQRAAFEEPQVNTRPIERSFNKPKNLFFDEPPPLEDDDLFSKEKLKKDDLFGDLDNEDYLWGKGPDKEIVPKANDAIDSAQNIPKFKHQNERDHNYFEPKTETKKSLDLFNDEDNDDEDDIFSTKPATDKKRSIIHEIKKPAVPFFDNEPPEINKEVEANTEKKKPVGGVLLLRNEDLFENKPVKNLPKTIQNRVQDENKKINEPPETASIDNSDIGNKIKVTTKQLNTNEMPKETERKPIDLFSKESNSLFDDDLFSDVSISTNSSSLFNDIFSKNTETKTENLTNEVKTEGKKSTVQTVPINKQETVICSDENSMFNVNDYEGKDSEKIQQKQNNAVEKIEASSSSKTITSLNLFDDVGDDFDDIFSEKPFKGEKLFEEKTEKMTNSKVKSGEDGSSLFGDVFDREDRPSLLGGISPGVYGNHEFSEKSKEDEIENKMSTSQKYEDKLRKTDGNISENEKLFDVHAELPKIPEVGLFSNVPPDLTDDWDVESNIFEDNEGIFERLPENNSQRYTLFDNEPPSLFLEQSNDTPEVKSNRENIVISSQSVYKDVSDNINNDYSLENGVKDKEISSEKFSNPNNVVDEVAPLFNKVETSDKLFSLFASENFEEFNRIDFTSYNQNKQHEKSIKGYDNDRKDEDILKPQNVYQNKNNEHKRHIKDHDDFERERNKKGMQEQPTENGDNSREEENILKPQNDYQNEQYEKKQSKKDHDNDEGESILKVQDVYQNKKHKTEMLKNNHINNKEEKNILETINVYQNEEIQLKNDDSSKEEANILKTEKIYQSEKDNQISTKDHDNSKEENILETQNKNDKQEQFMKDHQDNSQEGKNTLKTENICENQKVKQKQIPEDHDDGREEKNNLRIQDCAEKTLSPSKVSEVKKIFTEEPKFRNNSPQSSPGKLKHSLSINVNALLPVSPIRKKEDSKKLFETENTKGQLKQEERKENGIKLERSTSFDSPDVTETLKSVTKHRARVPLNRRPSTRKGRQESLRKSSLDFKLNSPNLYSEGTISPEISPQLTQESDENISKSQPSRSLPAIFYDHGSFITENTESILAKEKLPSLERNTAVSDSSKREDVSKAVQSRTTYEENLPPSEGIISDDLKNGVSQAEKLRSTVLFDSSDSDSDIFSSGSVIISKKKEKDPEPLNEKEKGEIFPNKTQQSSVNESHAFNTQTVKIDEKQEVEKKIIPSSIFSDDDDDDLFAVKTLPPKSNILTKSFFDSDEEDDLFGHPKVSLSGGSGTGKAKQHTKQIEKKPSKPTIKKLENSTVLNDPLQLTDEN